MFYLVYLSYHKEEPYLKDWDEYFMISSQSLRREQEENKFTIKRNYIWDQYWCKYIKMRVSPQQDDFDLYEDLNSFKNLQKKRTWNQLQGGSYIW